MPDICVLCGAVEDGHICIVPAHDYECYECNFIGSFTEVARHIEQEHDAND